MLQRTNALINLPSFSLPSKSVTPKLSRPELASAISVFGFSPLILSQWTAFVMDAVTKFV